MTPNLRIAVVVATYNWPAALDRVLASLADQTHRAFEVIVADDGSGPETADLIERWTEQVQFPLKHVWQEDNGFRLAAIRNRAVAATDAEYIVFLDGDCVVRSDFLARHAALADQDRFAAGNRVLLSREFSERILEQGLDVSTWSSRRWISERLSGGLTRWWPLLRLPPGAWRDRSPHHWRGAKGCNMAFWRDDLLTVNGLDEQYTGWGYEDSDLIIRLIRHGIRRRDGRLGTTVLHLWHHEVERDGTEQNLARLAAIQDNPAVRAEVGIDRYL
jgi:glycosyltransferase involved in cell wall biosynthesis